ncbi:MAG TPA: sugar O-acetyltransferase [Iamia sp.]|jgi:acetyltransferase-like isoleucine patch superfamily enzyme|nr:sugar O-acetyltransferase [Iamia sp.]
MRQERTIKAGTPESGALVERVDRAMRLSEQMASLQYEDADAVRAAWSELTGQPVDPTFRLVPPVRSDHGLSIRVGRNVFINHGCTLNDIGGIDIGDEVMVGPNVSLLTSGHPLDPATRRRAITAAPIRLGRNVWIGAAAIVLQGVTIGDDSVVGAGAVVTRDVPAGVLVAGSPARLVRSLTDEDRAQP